MKIFYEISELQVNSSNDNRLLLRLLQLQNVVVITFSITAINAVITRIAAPVGKFSYCLVNWTNTEIFKYRYI